MTDTYGPFDAPAGDTRQWTQDQWYRHAPGWGPSGVYGPAATSVGSGGLAITFSGLTPTIGVGRAWVRGAGFERTDTPAAQTDMTPNGNASLSRGDRIVLRRDLAAKTVTPKILIGTPASTPTAPPLTQVETGIWDIPLFSWTTPPNNGTTVSNVTDERHWLDPGGAMGVLGTYDGAYYSLPDSGDGSGNQVWGSDPQTIGEVDIADPGTAYRIQLRATMEGGSTQSSTRWDLEARLDTAGGALLGAKIGGRWIDTTDQQVYDLVTLPSPGIYTGAHKVLIVMKTGFAPASPAYGFITPYNRIIRACIWAAPQ